MNPPSPTDAIARRSGPTIADWVPLIGCLAVFGAAYMLLLLARNRTEGWRLALHHALETFSETAHQLFIKAVEVVAVLKAGYALLAQAGSPGDGSSFDVGMVVGVVVLVHVPKRSLEIFEMLFPQHRPPRD
jgi:hypothetical protein